MKRFRLISILVSCVLIFSLNVSRAQMRSGVNVNVNFNAGGGYIGGGMYGGYNHAGYAVAPYHGVVTGPIGYVGFNRGYGGYGRPPGYGYGGPGYNNRCSWDNYWHQWRCW